MEREVRDFLSRHGLDESILMDAKGLRGKALRKKMDRLGCELAANVTPCKRAGHRLRTRYSHCVMCDPTKLRYQNRFSEAAHLYIAKAHARDNLVKVGITTNVEDRKKGLSGYGGYRKWETVYSKAFPNAGRIEHLIHRELAGVKVQRTYQRDGRSQKAQELFECKPARIIELVESYDGEVLTKATPTTPTPKISPKPAPNSPTARVQGSIPDKITVR